MGIAMGAQPLDWSSSELRIHWCSVKGCHMRSVRGRSYVVCLGYPAGCRLIRIAVARGYLSVACLLSHSVVEDNC